MMSRPNSLHQSIVDLVEMLFPPPVTIFSTAQSLSNYCLYHTRYKYICGRKPANFCRRCPILLPPLLQIWPAVEHMDPPEGQAQGPTKGNRHAEDPALGVGLDGDIAGSSDQGALVPGTAAAMEGSPTRPAGKSASEASRETNFTSGQSRGESGSAPCVEQQQGRLRSTRPVSGGDGGGGGDAAAGDDDMTDMADTVGLKWGVDRGVGGGSGYRKKGAVSTSDVGAGGRTPQVCCGLCGCCC